MRPVDLAREHGLSAQAVRNYEEHGALPAAERTSTGYRVYSTRHRTALRAFLALKLALGHHPSLEIMRQLHRGDLDGALESVDRAHEQLRRDRSTLAVLLRAAQDLGESDPVQGHRGAGARVLGVGELAARIGISPATLRHWESRGLLSPVRMSGSDHRLYDPQQARDAELVHLLRRGGHGLQDIAMVLDQLRGGEGGHCLHEALASSRERVTLRGLALLRASAALADYVAPETTSLER